MNSRQWDKVVTAGLWLTGFFVIALLAVFLGYILIKGLPVLSWNFIIGQSSDITAGGGVGAQFFNTFYILFLSLLVAAPIAIGAGIYLAEYSGRGRLADAIRLSVECLASVPSIVLGLFGMIVFINIMGFGISLGVGAMTLALMNLPVIVRVTEEALKTVPKEYRDASLALGATKWQTIYKIVLPNALPGILTGVMLSMGRAAGETAPIMFTAAAFITPDLPHSPFSEVMALPYHIYVLATAGTNIEATRPLQYGTAIVLIMMVLLLNMAGMILRYKFKRRY